MQTSEESDRENIEIFVKKYPSTCPGWVLLLKKGHQTVRIRELAAKRALGRRFDVTTSDSRGTVSTLYERLESDRIRPLGISRLIPPPARVRHLGLYDVGMR